MENASASSGIRKRSIGVTIFGLLIIVLTILFSQPLLRGPRPLMEFYMRPFGIIIFYSGIAFLLFEVILGINILRLKEWARKYLIMLMLFFAATVFLSPFIINKQRWNFAEGTFAQSLEESQNYKEKVAQEKAKFEKKISSYPLEKQKLLGDNYDMAVRTTPRIVYYILYLIQSLAFLLWYLIVIFFFTRRKVKAQFSS